MRCWPTIRRLLRPAYHTKWACFVLALSLLYNPFVTSSRAPVGPSVQQLASYQGTVASAELLKFVKFDSCGFAITDATCDLPVLFQSPAPQLQPLFAARADARVHRFPSDQGLCSSLWFRPPPTA